MSCVDKEEGIRDNKEGVRDKEEGVRERLAAASYKKAFSFAKGLKAVERS
jgi:hypothetical protein